MWRRLLSTNLKTLAAATAAAPTRSTSIHTRSLISPSASASLFNLRHFTADSTDGAVKKRVEDVMPIATGHEREELEAELQGKKILESESEVLESESELSVVNYPCADGAVKKRVDIMSTASPEWREIIKFLFKEPPPSEFWIESELESEDEVLESESELSVVNYPCGPFGTKEKPAIIKSFYDKRRAGCSGGDGRDEHDYVFFWLEKGKPRECPVCPQYFELKVVGPGGPPPDRH